MCSFSCKLSLFVRVASPFADGCSDAKAPVFAPRQNVAAQKTYNNLDMTMEEVIRRRICFVEGVIKCYPDETLETIIDRIVKAEVDIFLRWTWFRHQIIREMQNL